VNRIRTGKQSGQLLSEFDDRPCTVGTVRFDSRFDAAACAGPQFARTIAWTHEQNER
jgi:hypothetical protein